MGVHHQRSRQLTYNKLSDFVSWNCRLFDFKGISCKHILAFFHVKRVKYLPRKFILMRWTKNEKVGGVFYNEG